MHLPSRRRVAEYVAAELAKGVSSQSLAKHLAAYLAERKQLGQVDLLIGDIEAALARRYGVVVTEVATTHPLTKAMKAAVMDLVRKTHEAKQIIFQETTDPALIGGITITTPRGQFDGSVRRQLRNLQAMKDKEI